MNTFRLGLISDSHIGLQGRPVYHNRMLGNCAGTILRSAVRGLKRARVNAVLMLGDLTNNGTERELQTARDLLSDLDVPWWITPGNHDAPAVASGGFRYVHTGRYWHRSECPRKPANAACDSDPPCFGGAGDIPQLGVIISMPSAW